MATTQGCCNALGGPDFSKMDFKKFDWLSFEIHVDWKEENLWFSIGAIFCFPAFYSMVHDSTWAKSFSSTTTLAQCVAFVLNIFKNCKFLLMTAKQPVWKILQNSWCTVFGYQLIGMGLLLYLICIAAYGPSRTIFALDFKEAPPPKKQCCKKKVQTLPEFYKFSPRSQRLRDLSKVRKLAAFFCNLGYSFTMASQAGIMVTVLETCAHSFGMTRF